MEEIHKFIDSEIKRLENYYSDKNIDELTMAMGFKVIEEIGELYEQILANKGYQRKDKLDNLDKEEIKKEFADVLFTILILARKFDVNIEEAIKLKMQEIKERDYGK